MVLQPHLTPRGGLCQGKSQGGVDRQGRPGYNKARQVNQQAVAKAFIGNAVKIRGSPLYCKDDERPYMSLSGGPDGKAGVRRSPSQETSRLWCMHDLSVGKAVRFRRAPGLCLYTALPYGS